MRVQWHIELNHIKAQYDYRKWNQTTQIEVHALRNNGIVIGTIFCVVLAKLEMNEEDGVFF